MKVDELSLEELWNLFSITFMNSNETFKYIYLEEENIIKFFIHN